MKYERRESHMEIKYQISFLIDNARNLGFEAGQKSRDDTEAAVAYDRGFIDGAKSRSRDLGKAEDIYMTTSGPVPVDLYGVVAELKLRLDKIEEAI